MEMMAVKLLQDKIDELDPCQENDKFLIDVLNREKIFLEYISKSNINYHGAGKTDEQFKEYLKDYYFVLLTGDEMCRLAAIGEIANTINKYKEIFING